MTSELIRALIFATCERAERTVTVGSAWTNEFCASALEKTE